MYTYTTVRFGVRQGLREFQRCRPEPELPRQRLHLVQTGKGSSLCGLTLHENRPCVSNSMGEDPLYIPFEFGPSLCRRVPLTMHLIPSESILHTYRTCRIIQLEACMPEQKPFRNFWSHERGLQVPDSLVSSTFDCWRWWQK